MGAQLKCCLQEDGCSVFPLLSSNKQNLKHQYRLVHQAVSVTTALLPFVRQKQSQFVPSGEVYLWVLKWNYQMFFFFLSKCSFALKRNYIQISSKKGIWTTQYLSSIWLDVYAVRGEACSTKPLLTFEGKRHKLQLEVSPVAEGQPCPHSWASVCRTYYIKSPYLLNFKYIDSLMEFDLNSIPDPGVINTWSAQMPWNHMHSVMFCGCVRPHVPQEGAPLVSSASGNGLHPYKLRTTALKQHPKIWPPRELMALLNTGFGNCLFFFQEANFTL